MENSNFMTYKTVIENLKDIKEEYELTSEQSQAIEKAIKLLAISDSMCLI